MIRPVFVFLRVATGCASPRPWERLRREAEELGKPE